MLDALVAEARVRWELDPAAGLQILPAERLASLPVEPSRPLLVVPLALLRGDDTAAAPLPGRHGHPDGASDAAGVLRRLYPAGHTVGRLGVAESTTVGALDQTALSGPLYVAPVSPELAPASPWSLPWLASRLRQPDGCPWDREQTHRSLKKHLLEETYEVYDALDGGSTPELAGELGDLLLQVVLHAQLAAEAGVFDMTDVWDAIGRKIVRRHPHVFGEAEARTAADVSRQWEQIKRLERESIAGERLERESALGERLESALGERLERESAAAGADDAVEADVAVEAEAAIVEPIRSALDGISASMPALAATQEMQERAAHLGYDWPEIVGVLDKVHEELAELAAAVTPDEKREEVGDLLLVVVNLARKEGVEAEDALRAAGEKFRSRFRRVERMARERGVLLRDLSFEELDALWDAAKLEERSGAPAGVRSTHGEESAQ